MERGKRHSVWITGGLLMLLVSCAGPPIQVEDAADSANGDTSDLAPRAETTEPELDQPQDDESSLFPCTSQQRNGVEETINAQTMALGEGDFVTAYSFASPSFQSAVTLEAFTQLIATSYGPLISSSELRFGDCLIDGGLAAIDVRFDQNRQEVFALRYVMQDTAAGWRVDGASSLKIVGSGT